jgi:hypothetical protein
VYFQDGYKLISAEQLVGALAALNEREITFRAFRAFMGCFELVAIREAAERSNPGRRKRPQRRFFRSELAELIGAKKGTTVSRELSSLKAAGLLTFTESAIESVDGAARSIELLGLLGSRGGKRLVPVPRQVIKFLARCTRPALAKTVIAYLIRGLALERSGKIRSAGAVKISWICQLCQISERAARAARADLIRLGWITKDTGSFQRKLNRDGAYFVINPAWRRVVKRLAPLRPKKCTRSAPPKERLETPYGSKNQKPAWRAESGVCSENGEAMLESPILRDIRPDDLKKPARLEELYRQAVKAGWITHSEASLRNFAGAALRATRAGGRVGAIFAGIVKKQLWHHITQDQESRACAFLRGIQEHGRFGFAEGASEVPNHVRGLVVFALQKSGRLMQPAKPSLQREAAARQSLRMQLAQHQRNAK